MVVGHNQNCCWAPPLSLTQGLKSTSNFKRGTIISYTCARFVHKFL